MRPGNLATIGLTTRYRRARGRIGIELRGVGAGLAISWLRRRSGHFARTAGRPRELVRLLGGRGIAVGRRLRADVWIILRIGLGSPGVLAVAGLMGRCVAVLSVRLRGLRMLWRPAALLVRVSGLRIGQLGRAGGRSLLRPTSRLRRRTVRP